VRLLLALGRVLRRGGSGEGDRAAAAVQDTEPPALAALPDGAARRVKPRAQFGLRGIDPS
jgi:hypothetical protein